MFIWKKILILLSVSLVGTFCAYGNDAIKKSIKLKVTTAFPPQARTTGTVGSNVTSNRNAWLQADIEFIAADEKNAAKRFIDSPQLEIQIATYSPQKPAPKNTARKTYANAAKKTAQNEKVLIFTGKVDYWTFEQNGKDHYIKALLPELFFRRYAYDRQLERTTFIVKAVLRANGKELATVYGSNKAVPQKEIQSFFKAPPKNASVLPDTVCGRNGTTWSIIEVNKYEMEKNK